MVAEDEYFDGYDMDEVLRQGDPTPRIVMGHVGSLDDGRRCSSASELAHAFGGPVFEPQLWPDGVGPPQFVLAAPPPLPGFSGASYRIFAELPGHPAVLLVRGGHGRPVYEAGESGWYEHPDLASVGGIAHWDTSAQVVVHRDDQYVHVSLFPSVAEAVRTARSLRRVDPPHR